MEIGTEISQKIRSAIKAKLIELGAYVDDELPDYIMVMVANKKTQKQMADDLQLFLSHNTDRFTEWLHNLLKKLQSINTGQEASAAKHKSKEKHKGEKRKHKTSQSDKAAKSGEPEKKKTANSSDKSATVKPTEGAEAETKAVSSAAPSEKEAPVTTTVAAAEETEINIIENTDEFNEENKEIEKKPESTKSSSTGKPPPAKVTKSKKSTEKRQSGGKSGDIAGSSEPRKKPSSAVVAVKRKYEEFEDLEEEYDPANPAVGNVASIIRGPQRKSSVPKSLQANRSLLMKAVSDAEKSVTTTKKSETPEQDEPAMRSDRRPVDLSRRLKTAAGLQLISRSKRKDFEKMKYTVRNDTGSDSGGKKARKTSGDGTENLRYTIKQEPITPGKGKKVSPKAKAPAVPPSRVAASALQDVSRQSAKMMKKETRASSLEPGSDNDDGRSSADSSEAESIESDEENESEEEDEADGEGTEESDEESEGSEEVEIEVTDRAAQTTLNMRNKHLDKVLGRPQLESEVQTDVVEFGVNMEDGLTYRLTKDKVEDIDSCLLHLFIDNCISLEMVENEAFKMFAKSLEPKYHFPKRKKLMNQIGSLYNRMKGHLRGDLSGAHSVTFTHSNWCNVSHGRYDTVSVHFISEDWQLRSAVLRTVSISGDNTDEQFAPDADAVLTQLAQHLEQVRVEWELDRPVVLTKDTEQEESVAGMLGWKRVSCFGACIQDLVKKCLQYPDVSEFIEKGRALINELRGSSAALDMFEQKKKLLLPKELRSLKLTVDDPTVWTSTLVMMSTLMSQTPALHAAIMDSDLVAQGVDLRSQLYNFTDQSMLESLIKIIKPFKTAAEILTNKDAPTLQKILPIIVKLKIVLDEDQDDPDMIKTQKSHMKSQVDTFLSSNKSTCLLACLVHPQTKQLAFMSQEDKDLVKKLLFEEIKEKFQKEFPEQTTEDKDSVGQLFKKGKKPSQKQTKAMSDLLEQTELRYVVVTEEAKDSSIDPKSEPEQTKTDNKGETDNSEIKDEPSVEPSRETGQTEDTVVTSDPIKKEVKQELVDTATLVQSVSVKVENDWLDDVICAAEERKSPEELAKVELDLYMAEPASSKNPLDWWREKQLVYPKISQVARRLLSIPASSLGLEDVIRLQNQSEFNKTDVKAEHIDMMVFLKKNWSLYE